MDTPNQTPETISTRWADLIPADQWSVFCAGRDAAGKAGVPFLLGGAMALAAFTGRWHSTKDVDFIVRSGQQHQLIATLLQSGFTDYFEREAYDRSWIFRGWRDDVILDVIWALPNHRVTVDNAWFEHARPVTLRGEAYQTMPLEEFIRVKLYVMQRQRCDWVDVLNALAGSVERGNWEHLIARMGPDLPLLQAVLIIFAWMAPGRVNLIPPEVRGRFALPRIETTDPASMEARRVHLFDSRSWYAAFHPEDRPLER